MGLSQEAIIAISCGSIAGLIVIVSAVIYFTRKSPSSEGSRLIQDPENTIETSVDQVPANYNTFQNTPAVLNEQVAADQKLSPQINQNSSTTKTLSPENSNSVAKNEQLSRASSHYEEHDHLTDSHENSGRSSPDLEEPKTPEPANLEVSQGNYRDKVSIKREKSQRKKTKKAGKLTSTRGKKKSKNNLF
ncbi:hypothetical protein CONCODRAFT_77309 [Conidiobolus coronatus NRRL 28638]|uniref:Uncharacterized protein n=1 Tax=Conidiobolus coronatus (strain ATCC 28846 / CBS 209.66 / NRRL 28638) TaxID=796925 RepID=A0A137PF17_CONC2|nr:hypothetical protein CONCODRAFT_77309 [Conidiobolus coronatus NRRL 28638]|eukprot:KXN73567.1 hypothetical protein CONCODRAFT_77309 [Conidiobolus coronatus NRRL 28638]